MDKQPRDRRQQDPGRCRTRAAAGRGRGRARKSRVARTANDSKNPLESSRRQTSTRPVLTGAGRRNDEQLTLWGVSRDYLSCRPGRSDW